MGKIQAIEKSLLFWKTPKSNVNLNQLRYAPADSMHGADKFIKNEFCKVTENHRQITYDDILNFKAYMLAKKVDTKVSPEEIKKLFSYEGEEFKLKSFGLLTEKLNIPKQLTPQFIYSNMGINSPMAYDMASNIILVNPNMQFASKSQFLSLLRHEFQHFLQNMNVYRHETKGKEAVKLYAKLGADTECRNIHQRAMDLTLEEIKELGFNEEGIDVYRNLQFLLDNERYKEYEQVLNSIHKSIEEHNIGIFENFRKTIIDAMGELKADSKEGKRAEKFFKETFSGQGYNEADGGIDYGKYFSDVREVEAMAAGDMIALKTTPELKDKGCYIKMLKENAKKFEAQSNETTNKINQDIERTAKENKEQGITFKDMISYLFD